jgi:hypothetical protein
MNYMLLIYHDGQAPEKPEGCAGLAERLSESGHYLSGAILRPPSAATSVQLRDGRRLVTDGPFAETHEYLAGYMLIEAKDLDEAITIAVQHPVAQFGTVEIRPIKEVPAVAHTAKG